MSVLLPAAVLRSARHAPRPAPDGRSLDLGEMLAASHHLLDGTPPVEGDQHVDDALVATGR